MCTVLLAEMDYQTSNFVSGVVSGDEVVMRDYHQPANKMTFETLVDLQTRLSRMNFIFLFSVNFAQTITCPDEITPGGPVQL